MDRVLSLCIAAAVSGFLIAAARGGNPEHGKELFTEKCTVCHTAEKDAGNRLGPNLFGVVRRPAGSIAPFSYLSAMKGSGVVWTADKLAEYPGGPQKMIRGFCMTFPGFGNPSDGQDSWLSFGL